MLHTACAIEYFPLTLTLSLRERSPRTLIAPCAHEPVFEHSFISNNLRVRFMGREQRAPRRESRKVRIVLHGDNGSPSPQGRGPG